MTDKDKTTRSEIDLLLDELDLITAPKPVEDKPIFQSPLPDFPKAATDVVRVPSEPTDSVFSPLAKAQPLPTPNSTAQQATFQVQANLSGTERSATTASSTKSDSLFDDNPLIDEDFRNFFTQTVTPKALLSEPVEETENNRLKNGLSVLKKLSFRQLFRRSEPDGQEETESCADLADSFENTERIVNTVETKETNPVAALQSLFADETKEEELSSSPNSEAEFSKKDRSSTASNPFKRILSAVSSLFVETTEKDGDSTGSEPSDLEREEIDEPAPRKKGIICSIRAFFGINPEEDDPESEGSVAEEGDVTSPEACFSIEKAGQTESDKCENDTRVFTPIIENPQNSAESKIEVAAAEPSCGSETVVFDRNETDSTSDVSLFSRHASSTAPADLADNTGANYIADMSKEPTPGRENDQKETEEEYTSPAQKQEISRQLSGAVHRWSFRCILLGLLSLAAVCMTVSAAFPFLPQLTGLFPALPGGFVPVFLHLILLLLGCGICLSTLNNGARSMIGNGSPDSFVFLSCCGALIQNLALFAHTETFDGSVQPVLTLFALLSLLTNALGKRSFAVTTRNQFEMLTVEDADYRVATLIHRPTLVNQLTHGLEENDPWLLVSRTADFYDGFIRQAHSAHPNGKAVRILSIGLICSGLLAGLLGGFFHGDFFSPLCYTLTVACPLTAVLVSSVPSFFMNRRATACDSILPGAAALEQLEQVNIITTTPDQLFPAGSVRLKGMKVFHNARIDLAILYAGSLLINNCKTLQHIFLDIIQDRADILYPVEDLTEEPCCGWCGTVNGRQLLVGSRAMMLSHEIILPQMDYEQRYTQNGRFYPVYLAVDGSLYAMFVVGYRMDRNVKALLEDIYSIGLSLLVSGDDFNLSAERIEAIYGIPHGCIKVLGAADTALLHSLTDHTDHCDGCLLHRSPFFGLVSGIRIAASGVAMEHAAFIIQTVFAVLSALLILIFSCIGSLAAFTPFSLLIYQLILLGFTLLLPVAKKY